MASSSTFPQSSSAVNMASSPPPPPPPPPSIDVAYQGEEWQKEMTLYRAVLRGEWDTAKQIFDEDPGAVKLRMGSYSEPVLNVAVAAGKSESFVSNLLNLISDDSSLALTDVAGNNLLHIAAITENYHAAEILVTRSPMLLYLLNGDNRFPHHYAALRGHRKILQLLISNTKDNLPINPFAGNEGLMLLVYMIAADLFDTALDLVGKYPYVVRMNPKSIDMVLTTIALKVTAFSVDDQLSFWKRPIYWFILKMDMKPQSFDIENETSILEPPMWRKLVLKLHSTLRQVIKYLAPGINRFHEKKLMREQALELVKCLCKHMELLDYQNVLNICVDTIIAAAESGNHDVVEEIVGTFPIAVHICNSSKQNFLLLAVKNRCEKVFNLIYQTSNYRYHYADLLDISGNSILHLAACLAPPHKLNLVSGAALQMQREIQWFQEARKFVNPFTRGLANHSGETAEMIFTKEHRELKAEGEKWMKDTANSCTIAAALIVTVVFAAAITVPGGNQSESGYPMFYKSGAFTIFAVSDAASLFTSTTSLLMFLSILTSRYAEQDFLHALPKRLSIGLFTLFLSILSMMIAFSSTVYLVFGRKNAWVLIAVGALACMPISSFVLLQYPLLRDVISSTYGRGIFGKQSDRPFH